MMRRLMMSGLMLVCGVGPLNAQSGRDPIEVPLRIEHNRMIVTAEGADGVRHHFVLGLAETMLTEQGAHVLGSGMQGLTVAGIPVHAEGVTVHPASDIGLEGIDAIGVIGGDTWNDFDALIDVPNGRLVLKPVGRTVRWDGVALSNPVQIEVFHGLLIRANVEAGGAAMTALLDLSGPRMRANESVRLASSQNGTVLDSFRMGYTDWAGLPVHVSDDPFFRGWVGDGMGFMVVGAPVAFDCAIAISWYHTEMRTCVR